MSKMFIIQAHYSMTKGAVFLGLGSDCVVKVDTDERGRMIASDLRQKIQEDIKNVSLGRINYKIL